MHRVSQRWPASGHMMNDHVIGMHRCAIACAPRQGILATWWGKVFGARLLMGNTLVDRHILLDTLLLTSSCSRSSCDQAAVVMSSPRTGEKHYCCTVQLFQARRNHSPRLRKQISYLIHGTWLICNSLYWFSHCESTAPLHFASWHSQKNLPMVMMPSQGKDGVDKQATWPCVGQVNSSLGLLATETS